MTQFFNSLFGFLLGGLVGAVHSLYYLLRGGLSIAALGLLFVFNLVVNLITNISYLVMGAYNSFIRTLPNPLKFIGGALLFGVVLVPMVAVGIAMGIITNVIDTVWDIAKTAVVTGLMAVAAPVVSLIDGLISGVKGLFAHLFSAPSVGSDEELLEEVEATSTSSYPNIQGALNKVCVPRLPLSAAIEEPNASFSSVCFASQSSMYPTSRAWSGVSGKAAASGGLASSGTEEPSSAPAYDI